MSIFLRGPENPSCQTTTYKILCLTVLRLEVGRTCDHSSPLYRPTVRRPRDVWTLNCLFIVQ